MGFDCCLFFILEILEDLFVVEEYYVDAFDFCFEESEDEEEEIVFLGLEEEVKDEV